jgi:ribosomal protein L35AE/L33A
VLGAADEIRTHDIYLGKVVLYQLSYGRVMRARRIRPTGEGVNAVASKKSG